MKKVLISLLIVFSCVTTSTAACAEQCYPSMGMDQFLLNGEETLEALTSEFLDFAVEADVKPTIQEALTQLITSKREAFNEQNGVDYLTNDEFLSVCTYTITIKIEGEDQPTCEVECAHVGMDKPRGFRRCWKKWTPFIRDVGSEKREITFQAQLIG